MATLGAESALDVPKAATDSGERVEIAPAPVGRVPPTSRFRQFVGSVYDVLNPATPGKAEMRNCDLKRAAMLKDRPR